METVTSDALSPLILCLVADEAATERCTTSLRYLQVGLLDEAIATVLVLPEDCPAEPLVSGPTQVVRFRHASGFLGPWSRRRILGEFQRAVEFLYRDAHVVVHSLSPTTAALAAQMAAAVGGDLIVGVWAMAEIEYASLAHGLNHAAVVLAPSAHLHRAMSASPLAAKPIEVVPIGAAASPSPAAFKAPQLAPTLVYVGSLSPEAGIEVLLRAVKRVLRQHSNLLMFVIGKGPSESNLRRLADALDLRAAVTFTGRLEHWRTVMASADVFCVPSSRSPHREEPVHALAAGLAVIAAEGSPYDGLTEGRTAVLFPDGDEEQLAAKIGRLLDDREHARAIAIAGQALARSQCSIARMVAEHARVYRRLAIRHRTLPMPTAR
jgi:glycosyltransferase involved in cell wall biosynthesis